MSDIDNITQIIELLKDKTANSIINPYVSLLKSCNTGVITRYKELIITKGCKLWQLQCCIFVILYKIDPTLVKNQPFLFKLCELYYNFLSNQDSLLYNFIIHNQLPRSPFTLRYISDKNTFKQHLTTNPISYLCIYGINKLTNLPYFNGIAHYFIIIKNGNDYYITSSYGSEQVCIPYYIEQLVTIEEFYQFCDCLLDNFASPDTDKNTQYITYFMTKYFLSNSIPKRYPEDDIDSDKSLHSKKMPPGVGEAREIKYILSNYEMYFDIAIITNYEQIVNDELLQHIFKPSEEQSKKRSKKRSKLSAGIIYTDIKYKKRKSKKSKRRKHKKPQSKKYKPGK
jgi:hypothetical protein